MKTVTGKFNAYITEYSALGPEDFKAPKDSMLDRLQYASTANAPNTWTLVGEATITVAFVSPDALTSEKVAALHMELQKHRADSHVIESQLEYEISKLLAIGHAEVAA